MTDRVHRSPLTPIGRGQRQRSHSVEAPGLCALEDYTYLAGESAAMRLLRAQLRRVSPHFRIALIIGEEGTGPEIAALALHRLSAESDAGFHTSSAASLLAYLSRIVETNTENDVADAQESDGGTAQAIQAINTRARSGINGKDPSTNGTSSTFFVPDTATLTSGEQMCLLRALQRFSSLKKDAERPRIVFASEKDLRALAGAGRFNRSLYKKISAVEIALPPLRSRPQDIPLITCGLLSRNARSAEKAACAFDGHALSQLQCYEWPGNVRELENIVDYARQRAGGDIIEPVHLPPLGEFARARYRKQRDNGSDRLEDVIRGHVLDVLLRCSGNKLRAAERLGISRSTLYRMLDENISERAV